MRRFARHRFSRASARSNAGNAAGSCDWNIARRHRGEPAASGANRRRLPSAASTSRADGVVHAHWLEAARHDIGRRLPARRVDERAIVRLDEQRLVGSAREQPVRLQRRQGSAACGWPDTASIRHLVGLSRSSARPAPRTPHRPTARGLSPVPVPVRRSATGRRDASSPRFQKRSGVAREEQATPMGWSAQALMPSCRHLSHTCRS